MNYYTPKELLSEIKRLMDLRDIPIKDLASRMHTSQQNVSKIFRNANPTLSTLFDICKALELDIDVNFIRKDDTE